MSLPLRAFLVLISIMFLFFVLVMVRRDRFLLKYSLIWVFLAILGVVAAIFPDRVAWLSSVFGFETPVNFLFLVCIMFLMGASFVFIAALSKQSMLVNMLVQELSILKAKQQDTLGQNKE